MSIVDDEPTTWVVISFWPYEPNKVFGYFPTEDSARQYAEKEGLAEHGGAYDVKPLTIV